MLRLGLAVLAFIMFVECWPPSKEHGLLLKILRRSPHYCAPEYQERAPTSPPIPPTPPAPPVPLPPPMPLYPPPPFWPGHHHHHHRHHGIEYQPKIQQLRDYQNNNPPCDTCQRQGTNTAVSIAKSETGNAVAIAISRPKPI